MACVAYGAPFANWTSCCTGCRPSTCRSPRTIATSFKPSAWLTTLAERIQPYNVVPGYSQPVNRPILGNASGSPGRVGRTSAGWPRGAGGAIAGGGPISYDYTSRFRYAADAPPLAWDSQRKKK